MLEAQSGASISGLDEFALTDNSRRCSMIGKIKGEKKGWTKK